MTRKEMLDKIDELKDDIDYLNDDIDMLKGCNKHLQALLARAEEKLIECEATKKFLMCENAMLKDIIKGEKHEEKLFQKSKKSCK